MEEQYGTERVQRGESVVVEDDISVLCSEEVLRSVLQMAQIVKKEPLKKK